MLLVFIIGISLMAPLASGWNLFANKVTHWAQWIIPHGQSGKNATALTNYMGGPVQADTIFRGTLITRPV